MEKQLYPLKFKTILKEVIWGGDKLGTQLGKDLGGRTNIGESWEISGVEGDVSIVDNGFLKENELNELIEVYMGELVGDKVYDEFGTEFPLLIKFIDANDSLSVQVHPDDEVAKQRHDSRGKTEMWHVLSAEKDASLIAGFNKDTTKEEYTELLNTKKLATILNTEKVNKGDSFFIPAGRVHAIGKGIVLAEIQETSNITYRIYDWDRVDKDGKGRELHVDQATDVIDYKSHEEYKTQYTQETNKPTNIADCKHFTTNVIEFDRTIERDYVALDSFVIHICLEGSYKIKYNEEGDTVEVKKGESVLLPAVLNSNVLETSEKTEILEVYIK